MPSLFRTARRAFALFRIRSLEIQLQGMNDAMQLVDDEETRTIICRSRQQVCQDLAADRAAYIATLPPGERRTWRLA